MSTPTLPADHDDYGALAVAWAVNALEPADQAIFEAHREGCDRCTQAAYAALDVAAELAYGVPDAAPPMRLRERVLAAALPDSPNGQLTALPGRADVVPASRPAPDGETDRSDNGSARGADPGRGHRPAAGSASADDLDRDGRPVAPRADDEADQPDGRPAARPTSGAADRSEGPPVARPAAGDDADRPEGPPGTPPPAGAKDRPPTRPTSGWEAWRSGTRPAGEPTAGGDAGRRPKGAGPGPMARRLRGPRRLVYALAAAVLVVGSAVTAWGITRPPPVTDRIAALDAGSGTVATVVVHQRRADVVTDMLPPNAGRGTAYYVWGVPAEDGGTPQIVGTFEVTTTGLHSYPLRLTRSLDGYPVLAISEEKARSTPSAPSSVLGKGALGG